MRASWVPHVIAATLTAGAGLAAYRSGGATERHAPPPHAASNEDASPGTRKAVHDEADQVVLRLVDALADARYEAPSLRAGLYALDSHWRKMQTPWVRLTGPAAKSSVSYAVLTSQEEKEYTVALKNGGVWKPDARQWNMAEGSFDQRNAIFAPTPSTVGYRLNVPPRAYLDLSTTADGATHPVAFSVRVVDARGEDREVWRQVVNPKDGHKWIDARVDLAAYAGQNVELDLVTRTQGSDTPTLALWGNPVVLARQPSTVPYNVLWIVVDATRADAIASFHDDAEDAAKRSAPVPPGDGMLPKIPGLTPSLDDLGRHGVRFTHAYSAASWTRPGTVAMLGGARSTEFGLDSLHWVLPDREVSQFYASSPPLLPLLLRRAGVVTRAFVNNYFMVGYAQVGVDLGFEATADFRFRTLDTREITTAATRWLTDHKDERFFLFCNYNSPHEPLDPPARFLSKIPAPPAGPTDYMAARYMAEVGKDDEAIGVLMKTLDDLHLRDHTIVVMTADHGETLSSAHDGVAGIDKMRVRYHHSASDYEETTHVPILLSLPGVVPEDLTVNARARTIDMAPTILDLEGLEQPPKMSGKSLMPLVRGEKEPDERVVVSEGRGIRAILVGNDRYISREGKAQIVIHDGQDVEIPEELYDLAIDPGERKNVAKSKPEKVAEMRARLAAALKGVPVAGTETAASETEPQTVTLRFAGRAGAHRVTGSIAVDPPAKLVVHPVGVAAEAIRATAARADLSFTTSPDAAEGVDVTVEPRGAPVRWELYIDDRKLSPSEVFGGPFGLSAPSLVAGVTTDEARTDAFASAPALVDPARDFGLFVTRSRGAEGAPAGRAKGAAGTAEMVRLMKEWGYARDKSDLH